MKLPNPIIRKLLGIGALILTMQIPLSEIQSLIRERASNQIDAQNSVAEVAGTFQELTGPFLVVPYIATSTDSEGRPIAVRYEATLFPDSLSVKGKITTEKRYRGIFEVPTYTARMDFEGDFDPSLISPPDLAPTQGILWEQAILGFKLSDPRSIRDQVTLSWNGKKIEFEPGSNGQSGIHAKLPGLAQVSVGTPQHYSFSLVVGGTNSLSFVPAGKNTSVALTSDWANPSFSGSYIPLERDVRDDGFSALWKVPDLGRGFSRLHYSSQASEESVPTHFGVTFLSLTDGHRMAERAVKYDVLFVFMTFLVFFMFEIFTGKKVHPIQYLLIGGALSVFYLLLLSISEHTGFFLAYCLASVVPVLLISGYSWAVLKGAKSLWVVPTTLITLYGFLYTLLIGEDHSLLAGSIGLTLALGAVMYLTRNINWYSLSDELSTK